MSCYKKNNYDFNENYGNIFAACSNDSAENSENIENKEDVEDDILPIEYHNISNVIESFYFNDDGIKQLNIGYIIPILYKIEENLAIINSYEDQKKYELLPILAPSIPTYDNICKIVEFIRKNKCQVLEINSGRGLWSSIILILLSKQILEQARKNPLSNYKTVSENLLFFLEKYFKTTNSLKYIKTIKNKHDDHLPVFYITDTSDLINCYGYGAKILKGLEEAEYKAIETYKDVNCLFLCRPPNDMDVIEGLYNPGNLIEKFKGKYIIYIGNECESGKPHRKGSNTGTIKFCNILQRSWKLLYSLDNMSINIPGKLCISDKIYFYERDETKEEKDKKPDGMVRDTYIVPKVDLDEPLLP